MENQPRQPWNKGKLVGQKAPLKLRDIWAIRIRLQLRHRTRDLALFDTAIDSKLRACDLVKLRVLDVAHGDQVASRAIVMQQKTHRPVQFEITEQTKQALREWITTAGLRPDAYLFPSRVSTSRIFRHANTRGSCIAGWLRSGWMVPRTERIRCGARKYPLYTAAPRTCGPYNCCSAMQSLKAPSVT